MSIIESGGLLVERCTKVKGTLKVGPYFPHNKAHLRQWVLIPFTIIRGAKDGVTLCITAGCHATEYAGIDAAIRLSRDTLTENLKGNIIIVSLVNVPGFYERNYINPIDGKNL